LDGKKLEVFPHVKKSTKSDELKPEELKFSLNHKEGNNVYVQGLTKGFEEESLTKIF